MFLYYIVGANCVRPFFICYELAGDRIFSLPCKGCGSPVETSAFNAEAPTEPAGETVGCRRQLGGIVRLILYKFIKIPQSFFCSKKTTAPFTREPLTDSRKTEKINPLPLTGNVCDRRLWRIKGASVGAAVDFVRRSKPHKQNRDTARGQ